MPPWRRWLAARWRGRVIQVSQASRGLAIAALVAITVITGQVVSAQIAPSASADLAALSTVPVPEPDNIQDFIRDKQAAIALGKAFFWDMQVGSDGLTSCATCHFHAGADSRSKNQISPGLLRRNASGAANPDNTFQIGGAPNYQLQPGDYPFHKLSDPLDRDSAVLSDSNDVTSSQGVFLSVFNDVKAGNPQDIVTYQPDLVFNVNGTNTRRVEPRNTPSAINAVFNFRNFWDGRAQNDFNGVNPFGKRDPDAFVLQSNSGALSKVTINLNNSSLASQAVGPPLSGFEMSASGRSFPEVGTKLSSKLLRLKRAKLGKKIGLVRPLSKQLVHRNDSVLGGLSRWPLRGLSTTYDAMIRDAFKPKWWNSKQAISIDPQGNLIFTNKPLAQFTADEFTQLEYNFSLFFGLAIQAYEATLVSDASPFDKFMEGNSAALTAQQKRGLDIFQTKAKCISCHAGAEFTKATVRHVQNEPLERMNMAQGVAVYDNGFYNIGVRPTLEDVGVGGTDPFGKPLSMSRLAQQQGPPFPIVPGENGPPTGPLDPNERVAVDGAFKTPSLRNVELTAPYFHNGGQRTLNEVVAFYNRGGDFHDENIDNLDPDIERLNLTPQEQEDLVAFLKSLTDPRVASDKAPFDHPQLFVPNGHLGDHTSVIGTQVNSNTVLAKDDFLEIPAVGRGGGAGTANFLAGAAQTSTVAPSGTANVGTCPAGTTYVPLTNGFICQ
ncbi:MAG: c-type cytochrome [Scytolyngbya sp. HA4215-MV1]|nr:c-type cytochrome [Scytolyngbya sp. HA4215-MV1]